MMPIAAASRSEKSAQPSDVRPSAPSKVAKIPNCAAAPSAPRGGGDAVKAVLAGNIFKVNVAPGDTVQKGDPLLVVEAMKMETEVAAPRDGSVTEVKVAVGDVVAVGDALVMLD